MNVRTPASHAVITVTGGEGLTSLLATSAAHLYPYVALFPDMTERPELLPRYFRHELACAHARSGVVRATTGLHAAAVWILHDGRIEPEPEPYPADIAGRWSDRLNPFATERHRTRAAAVEERAHQHLLTLAVRPGRHGQGLEARLLDDQLARNDAENLTTYADPGEEAFASYLRDFGFEPAVEHGAVRAGPVVIYPMLRAPRAT
jgi:GNAT superfamily N-acetyltransferase